MAAASLSHSPALSVPSGPTLACIRCAERKVKCDRQRPCSACVNHKVDCIFQPPRPPQKRHRYGKEHVQLLSDRLNHYESLLQERGIDLEKIRDYPGSDPNHGSGRTVTALRQDVSSGTPSSTEAGATGFVSKTQIIHGRGGSMFVDNSLWSRVAEELHDSESALESSSDDSHAAESPDDDFGFVLGSLSQANTIACHPSTEHLHRLWQAFVENVDPLTKVVHVPTFDPLIRRAISSINSVPRNLEPLLHAIYSVAVMSLDDSECKERLGESRMTLLSRYIASTKVALSRAKFMSTTSLLVLQALVLHILSVRDSYEPRAVWSLTGVALRIAQSMGLDRDGSSLGLSPFETEMRRRIWWLLKTHDYHAAELCGLSKFQYFDIGTEDTKWPSNLNDNQLYPGMTATPMESEMLTDVAFVRLRYELASFATRRVAKYRQQGKGLGGWERHLASGEERVGSNATLKEMEEHLETKYLRYCDPSQPLHLMTMLLARAAINTVKFLTHHPRRWANISHIPPNERQWVWEVCIKLLEQHNMLQSNPQLKHFAWHAASVMQWHAFIHILDTLRVDPHITNVDKVWDLIGNIYKNNQAMIMDTRKPIHIAVASLCLKAYDARAATLVSPSDNLHPLPAPEFILQLRKQRIVARANNETRPPEPGRSERTVFPDTNLRLDADILNSGGTSVFAEVRRTGTIHISNAVQSDSGGGADDPFLALNGIDNYQNTSGNEAVNMSNDLLLSQDRDGESNAYATISWEQWDTWLAESNVML
ncbi:hypothetical protein CONLIGDRAFT_279429 [Coniochaeta ligniaria NRRL 30616]|uniref:Zn(2)-C6 fungal-type domain-containing protein n=1 Tax=Coniochaeta ligniaria NRRL 30616 TaxID=1408157 RepID=A0A1J7JKS9_9PEZI|nr:hypothetical protein CONLIGDRAFT_279429 [Coniochaeta ligniaria NRRL 30616]